MNIHHSPVLSSRFENRNALVRPGASARFYHLVQAPPALLPSLFAPMDTYGDEWFTRPKAKQSRAHKPASGLINR
ncbi:hypothetical protein VPH35_016359 [Triticum aestivum]